MSIQQMQRRAFIAALGGAAAWPLAASAQQKPVIGFLNSGSADAYSDRVTAFHQGLRQLGFIEGENVVIVYRWALGQYDRLTGFAAELVERHVSVLVATGGEPAALAAKSATSTIPIVFAVGGDPIKLGLVASYNRPGGNATGANILAAEMDGKRLGLLHEMMPNASHVGVLLNPDFPAYAEQLNDLQHAARIANLEAEVLQANTDGEIEAAFEIASQKRVEALVLTASPFFDTRRDKLVELAAGHALPTIYHFREFAVAGGLMSYGVSIPHIYRQVGVYAGRILKGDNPAKSCRALVMTTLRPGRAVEGQRVVGLHSFHLSRVQVVGFINSASAQNYTRQRKPFSKVWARAVTLMGATLWSSTAGLRAKTIGCRQWRPIWYIVRWR